MENVSTLQTSVVPRVQRTSSEPGEKDAQFLALRLLNKRTRVRLSPEPIDLAAAPGKVSLFAVANARGWFVAVTRDASGHSALILSPLSALNSAFATDTAEDEKPFAPQRRVPLHGPMPIMVAFPFDESKLLVGLADNSIAVYEADHLCSPGDGQLAPVHTFPASPSVTLLSIHPNPEGLPELVAVLRDCSNNPSSLTVELLDVQKLVSAGGWVAGNSPSTVPTAVSWSPKGKQLALGMQGGDIVTYNPANTATPKCSIPHPPSADGMSVISIHWLSTSSFHAIYAPVGKLAPDAEQAHFHVSLDSKANSVQDLKFNPPYFPFPALRPPGSFAVILKNWDPYKTILFLGDSTSSDIGVIGAITDGHNEDWHNLSLEETSTPNLPLDKDQNDTVLIGQDLALTNTESYRHTTASGEPLDLPPPPIMYAYASDGTVLGWYLLNTSGNVYHGMVKETAVKETTMSLEPPSSLKRAPSTDMQTTPSVSPSAPESETTPFGRPPSTPHQPTVPVPPPPSGFTQTSPFGMPSTSVFTQTPTFGQSSFDQLAASAPSPFSQSSPPTFGSAAATTSGFGAFTSTTPAKFGQSAFGFGFGAAEQTPSTASAPTAPGHPSESGQEDGMAEDGPSLDGLGLGGLSSTRDTESKPSIFGNSATPTSFQQPSSGGGNEGLIKSGVGFGAALDQNSPFAKPSSFAPSGPSFGQSTFGQTTTSPFTPSKPAFGQTSFQQPAFGQSGFGQPAFGQPAFGQAGLGQSQTTGSGGLAFGKPSFGSLPTTSRPPDAPATSTSGGAFEAFATDGATGFAAFANKVSKPVWAASEDQKNAPEKSRAVFGPSTTSALAPAPEPALAKAEPVRITGEQTKPAAAALPSSLFAARESPLPQTESRSPSPVGSRLSPSPPTTSPKAATRESPLPQTESRSPSPVGGRLSPSPPTTSPKAATRESPLPQTESRSPSPVGGRPSPSPPTTSPKAATPIASFGSGDPLKGTTTTPPGSPVKEAAFPAPASKPPLPAGSPFNLPPRIGTNNRPIRSSPLASTPLVGELDSLASPTPPPPSKSAPPVVTAPVDQWRTSVKKEDIEPPPPKASTLLSTGGGESRPVFGVTPLPAPAPTVPAPPSLASFNAPTAFSSFVASPPASTLFGTPDRTPPPPKPMAPFTLPSSPLSTSSLQSVGITPPSAGILPVAGASPAGFSHSVSMFPPPVTPVSTPPIPTPEQGMQAECLNLLSALTEEFENLRTLATAASQKAASLRKSSGIVHTRTDLLDSHRWVIGDVKEHGRVLLTAQEDIRVLREQRVVLRRMLQDLDGCMLKAMTKREEIIRFDKARTDAEFAKMLKVRTLGPEYLEIQTQLRRDIRAIRDRVQKLEDHLQASKRKLQEFKTGKPRFRPPSIDTINRTLRNIDLAISQQQREVDELLRRVSALNINPASDGVSSSSREKCEKYAVVPQTKRPWNVTPNVAASTAAALNAERAAQKLKRALLASRDSPLLNSKAKVTTSKLMSFQTPPKASAAKPETETVAPASGPFLPATPMMTLPPALPTWSLTPPSDIGDSPLQNTLPSRHRGSTKHHQKPIALKKNTSSFPTSATAGPLSFDWGPVQPIKPMTSLAFDLRQRSGK